MEDGMIRLEGIEKVYRTDRIETVALANVNLAIAPGEFVSVMGPSGSGKSTLLNVIGLLDAPTQRPRRAERPDHHVLRGPGPRAAAQRGARLRLPDVPPHRGPARRRQRRDPAPLPEDVRQGAPAPRPRRARARGPLLPRPPLAHRSSPAGSSSASRSRARSSAGRRCFWPTSPRATSTARWATRSWPSCAS